MGCTAGRGGVAVSAGRFALGGIGFRGVLVAERQDQGRTMVVCGRETAVAGTHGERAPARIIRFRGEWNEYLEQRLWIIPPIMKCGAPPHLTHTLK